LGPTSNDFEKELFVSTTPSCCAEVAEVPEEAQITHASSILDHGRH
jgi:hypothetical protein